MMEELTGIKGFLKKAVEKEGKTYDDNKANELLKAYNNDYDKLIGDIAVRSGFTPEEVEPFKKRAYEQFKIEPFQQSESGIDYGPFDPKTVAKSPQAKQNFERWQIDQSANDIPAITPGMPIEQAKKVAEANKEQQFQKWINTNPKVLAWKKEFKNQYGVEPDINSPGYDYRGAFEAGITPEPNETDGKYHWGSIGVNGKDLKAVNHPTRWKSEYMKLSGENPDENIIDFNSAQMQYPELNKYNPQQLTTQPEPAEKGSMSGFGKELGQRVQRSGWNLNEMLANTPDFINRVAVEAINLPIKGVGKLAEVSGLIDTADNWKMVATNLKPEKVNEYIQGQKGILTSEIAKINPKHNIGIVESAQKGDWASFTRNLAGGVADSFAPSLAMMISGGTMGVGGMIAGSTAVFGAGKYAEMNEQAPNMSEQAKVFAAATNGALEGIFETYLGSGAVGSAIRNVVATQGRKAATDIVNKGIRQGFIDLLIKHPALAPLGEGFEEMGTQIAQNYVDKISGYKPDINIMDGVVDYGLIGTLSGGIHTGVLYGAKAISGKEKVNPEQSTLTVDPAQAEEAKRIRREEQIDNKISGIQDNEGNVTTVEIDGQKWFVKNSEDLGKPGATIFVRDEQGNVKPVNSKKITTWNRQTPEEVKTDILNEDAFKESERLKHEAVIQKAANNGIVVGAEIENEFGTGTVTDISKEGIITAQDEKGQISTSTIDETAPVIETPEPQPGEIDIDELSSEEAYLELSKTDPKAAIAILQDDINEARANAEELRKMPGKRSEKLARFKQAELMEAEAANLENKYLKNVEKTTETVKKVSKPEKKLTEIKSEKSVTEPTKKIVEAESSQKVEPVAESGEQKLSTIDKEIAAQNPNLNPTEKQKKTGNFNKARVNVQGYNITIETPKGAERSGTDDNGKEWSVIMNNHYGELDGTAGYDGDPIDVFLGENPDGNIFVIDQNRPGTNNFDESKVMLGFDTAEQAKQAYLSNFEEGWTGFRSITPAGDNFKQWLYDGAKQRKPFGDYKNTPEPVKEQAKNVEKGQPLNSTWEERQALREKAKKNLVTDDLFNALPEKIQNSLQNRTSDFFYKGESWKNVIEKSAVNPDMWVNTKDTQQIPESGAIFDSKTITDYYLVGADNQRNYSRKIPKEYYDYFNQIKERYNQLIDNNGEPVSEEPYQQPPTKEEPKEPAKDEITKEEKVKRINRLIDDARYYDEIRANHTKKKAAAGNDLQKLANSIGYSIGKDTKGKTTVFDENKQPVTRKIPVKQSKEYIQSHKALSDYEQAFQDIVNWFAQDMNRFNQVKLYYTDRKQIQSAIKNIQSGTKTVAANNLLDDLEGIFNKGEISFSDGFGAPLNEFMAMFETEEEVLWQTIVDNNISEEELNLLFLEYENENDQGETQANGEPVSEQDGQESIDDNAENEPEVKQLDTRQAELRAKLKQQENDLKKAQSAYSNASTKHAKLADKLKSDEFGNRGQADIFGNNGAQRAGVLDFGNVQDEMAAAKQAVSDAKKEVERLGQEVNRIAKAIEKTRDEIRNQQEIKFEEPAKGEIADPIGIDNQIEDVLGGQTEEQKKQVEEKTKYATDNVDRITEINGSKVYDVTIDDKGRLNYNLRKTGKKTDQKYYYPIQYAEIKYSEQPKPKSPFLDERLEEIKKEKAREKLESELAEKRKQNILSEGTSFDKPFGLIPANEIKTADDIQANVNKIISTLKANEGNKKYDTFEGFAYGGKYAKNAGEQIREYFISIDVLPTEIRKAFAEKIGVKTSDDIVEWGAKQYKEVQPSVKVKEPWEMTREELLSDYWLYSKVDSYDKDTNTSTVKYELKDKNSENVIASSIEYQTERATKKDNDKIVEKLHKQLIQKAISEGKTISSEVKAEYPELFEEKLTNEDILSKLDPNKEYSFQLSKHGRTLGMTPDELRNHPKFKNEDIISVDEAQIGSGSKQYYSKYTGWAEDFQPFEKPVSEDNKEETPIEQESEIKKSFNKVIDWLQNRKKEINAEEQIRSRKINEKELYESNEIDWKLDNKNNFRVVNSILPVLKIGDRETNSLPKAQRLAKLKKGDIVFILPGGNSTFIEILENNYWQRYVLENIDDVTKLSEITTNQKPIETPGEVQSPDKGEVQEQVITDPSERQRLLNGIAEGESILKSGKTASGRKMEAGELEAVKRSVDNSKRKLGENIEGENTVMFRMVEDETIPETITIYGKQRPTTNSAGRPIHPTIEGIKNFYEWFGNSQAVDEQGRPIVVYSDAINFKLKDKEPKLDISEKANPDIKEKKNTLNALNSLVKQFGVPITVIHSSELSEVVGMAAKRMKGTPVAFYHNGTAYIISDKIQSVSDTKQSYLHEAILHKGLDLLFNAGPVTVLGKKFETKNELLDEVYSRLSPELISEIAEKYTNGETSTPKQQREIAEEALAKLNELDKTPSRLEIFMDSLWKFIKKLVGFSSKQFTKTELYKMLSDHRKQVKKLARGGISESSDPKLNSTIDFFARIKDIAQTETAAFKKWFGNSKVVDEKGNPLVVYHGTQNDFDAFDGGAFFTDDYMNADGYASGENVIEAFIKIERPLIINARGRKWDNIGSKFGNTTIDIVGNLDTEKYDGVIFNNVKDSWIDDIDYQESGTIYYVVNPTQIKSATGNRGTFDENDPNINFRFRSSNPELNKVLDELDEYKKSGVMGTTIKPPVKKVNVPKTEGKGVEKTIVTERTYKGDIPDAIRKRLEEIGLTRETQKQKVAEQIGLDIIEELGLDRAIEAVRNYEVIGAPAGAIYHKLLQTIKAKMNKETDPERYDRLAKEYADTIEEMGLTATIAGQYNAFFNYIYQTSDLGFNAEVMIRDYKEINNGEISAELEAKFKQLEKEFNEVLDKLSIAEEKAKQLEEQAAIDAIKASIERQNKRKAKASEKIRETTDKLIELIDAGKLNRPGIFMAASPASLAWDLAMDTVKTAVKATGRTIEAIAKGWEAIKSTDWYKNLDANKQKQAKNAYYDYFAAKQDDKEQAEPKEKDAYVLTKNGIRIPHSIIRDLVGQGIDNINDLTQAVYDIIVEDFPEITIRETRDAITGYGITMEQNQEQIEKEIRKMKDLGRVISGIEDVEEGQRPKKSGLQRDKPDPDIRAAHKRLREKMKDLPIDVELELNQLKTRLDAAKQRLINQIEDLQREIDKGELTPKNARTMQEDDELQRLKALRDAKKKEHDAIFNDEEFVNKKRVELTKKAVNRRIAELEKRIAEGDFAPKQRKELIADNELIRLRAEKLRIQEEYKKEMFKAKLRNRTQSEKIKDGLWDAWGVTRALRATGEFSFVGIQGLINTIAHPIQAKMAFKNSMRFLASQRKADDWMNTLKSQDFYPALKESKLAITEPNAELTAREELFYSGWTDMIWNNLGKVLGKKSDSWMDSNPLRAIERAAVGYLDTQRVLRYLDGVEMLKEKGLEFNQANKQAYVEMADVINTFTGRGSIGRLDPNVLTKIFFSPRNWSSVIKTATPYAFYHFGKKRAGAEAWKPSVAQKMALADFSKFVGLTASIVALAAVALNGDDDDETKVELDPRSTDFGKIKIGSTRIDPWGGRIQQIVLISRLMNGNVKNSYGEVIPIGTPYKSPTGAELLFQMATNKLAPSASILYKHLSAKVDSHGNKVDTFGEPYSLTGTLTENLYPIYWETLTELAQDDVTAIDGLLAAYAFFGGGVNVYDQTPEKLTERKLKEQTVIKAQFAEDLKAGYKLTKEDEAAYNKALIASRLKQQYVILESRATRREKEGNEKAAENLRKLVEDSKLKLSETEYDYNSILKEVNRLSNVIKPE